VMRRNEGAGIKRVLELELAGEIGAGLRQEDAWDRHV
jgi:hypothetical protein